MKTVTTEEMKKIDEHAINVLGIPSLTLMENAANHITDAVIEISKDIVDPTILFVCGTGNNGGDGFASARQLLLKEYKVICVLIGNVEKLTRDAKVNHWKLTEYGGEIIPYDHELPDCDVIVDCIFGFGLNREVTGEYFEIIQSMNKMRKKVIACDIPSGLNGTTGEIMGIAVKADLTVTFTYMKQGLVQKEAKEYTGTVELKSIGVPICHKNVSE